MRLSSLPERSWNWSGPTDLVRAIVLAIVLVSLRLPYTVHPAQPAIAVLTGLAGILLAVRIVGGRPESRGLLPLPDLIYTLLLVGLSGGIHSPYFPTLFLVVMVAGITHGPESAGWTAGIAGVLMVALEARDAGQANHWALMDDAMQTLPYLFLVGLLTGQLSGALRRQQAARLAAHEENLRLQHEGEVLQRELELAARVQRALLPAELPAVPGAALGAFSRPCRQIGGDLYDFLPMPDGTWLFLAADVCGHGIPAALLAASTQQAVRHHAGPDLAAMLARVSEVVLAQAPDEMFVTAVAATLDPRRGIVRCVNAGHPPPLWWRAATGELVSLAVGGLPLGVLAGRPYRVEEVRLAPGDTLLFFTDGVLDAYGPDGERLEEEGLRAAFRRVADRGPEGIVTALSELLAAGGELPDDITLLAVQWVGVPHSSITETLAPSLLPT
jgi:serine phosphatase RsbU (regulator of sigma subunit)